MARVGLVMALLGGVGAVVLVVVALTQVEPGPCGTADCAPDWDPAALPILGALLCVLGVAVGLVLLVGGSIAMGAARARRR